MPLKATGAPGLARLLCKDPGTQNRSLSSRQPVSSLCPQGGVLAAGEQAPCGRPGPPSPPKRNRIKDAEKLLQGSTFRLCPTGLIGVCVGPARQPPALLPRLSSVTPHPPPRALLSPLTQKVRSHRPQGSWCPGRSVREGPCPLEPSCGRQAGGGRHSNQGHAGTTASSKDGGGQLSGSSCSSVLPGDLFERGTLTSQASTASGPLGWALHMEGTFATLGGRGCGEPTGLGVFLRPLCPEGDDQRLTLRCPCPFCHTAREGRGDGQAVVTQPHSPKRCLIFCPHFQHSLRRPGSGAVNKGRTPHRFKSHMMHHTRAYKEILT